ncbi:hypothetical protein [Mobilicoccus caccae]|uniref:Ig-like domain-containing protein n=1 Tax=Mobilicoccus caccae TaxID=1859295 RepID=A0ABQ6ILA2_9MICO|nr:hypothetical protein [Mobilicoccus caccae]GMA38680.1 hypothetical protein GCM10025883_07250 [Mobilicoccus caccae]
MPVIAPFPRRSRAFARLAACLVLAPAALALSAPTAFAENAPPVGAPAAGVAKPAIKPAPGPRESCSPIVPPVVTTSGPSTSVVVKLDASCPMGASAGWRVVSPSGAEVGRFTLTGHGARTLTVPTPDATSIGKHRLVPVFGHDADYGQLVVVPGSLVVKAGSTLTATAAPENVTVAATRYDAASAALRPWSGATAALQHQTCVASTCTWSTISTARTDAAGRATFTRPTAVGAATYRIITTATATVGGRAVAIAPR